MPPTLTTTVVLFSSAEEYFATASRELRGAFPTASLERLGPDIGALSVPGMSLSEVAELVRGRPIAFVRHLSEELRRIPVAEATPGAVAEAAVRVVGQRWPSGQDISVQCWVSGKSPVDYGSRELFESISTALAEQGYPVRRGGTDGVLSASVSNGAVSIGFAATADALSDWPGGRVRLAKREELISRAELKLEEAIGVFDLRLPARGSAVDLGASPGGWTSILLRHGLEVWAVDPGDLDQRLVGRPRVHHERTTSGQFFATSRRRFDLAVNDMRMDPELSCSVMLDAADHLAAGAPAVITLKLGLHRPLETVDRCFALLRRRYEVLGARQLQHNRHEITVLCRRAAARSGRGE
ncbi:MAG TPA: SAM-dependent methyltransferase [Pseudonocardiaceae bacterium]|jgi:23S rRNA (cytidine2498-2'-O)-methyltransferase|nr:SAM-dependent methyltransferase [Pseudonocardiaceae bacterium]